VCMKLVISIKFFSQNLRYVHMCVFFVNLHFIFLLTLLCLSLFFKFYIYLKISTFVFLDAELRLQQTELRAAREKVKRAEEAQLLLGTQIVTRPLRGGERIRRTQSFIPTTKERPLSLEKIDIRSTTLQKNIWHYKRIRHTAPSITKKIDLSHELHLSLPPNRIT